MQSTDIYQQRKKTKKKKKHTSWKVRILIYFFFYFSSFFFVSLQWHDELAINNSNKAQLYHTHTYKKKNGYCIAYT